MALRIPLPVKLMLSYLVVVTIGAGPTFVYVRAKLQTDLLADAASLLVARTRRVAHTIATTPPADRDRLFQLVGEMTVDRITFMSLRGEVLYDNDPGNRVALENQGSFPEVSYAMGNAAAQRPSFAATMTDCDGVGISRRPAARDGIDTLYVALLTAGSQGESSGILRLATPVHRIGAMTSGMVRFARNAQAVAVSLAIGFSLLAAILFVRPLQRVRAMVSALSAGDIGAQVGDLANDEVGDVGRALDQMALSLRQRLLAAGLGEALLAQLVEALPTPCVVFEETGEVVAINGAARRGLWIEGPEAGKRMRDLAEHPQVRAALQAAEDEGEPEPIELPLSETSVARGSMHVLKRPGIAPLRVFIGAEVPPTEPSLLPLPEHVEPRSLDAVLAQARKAAQPEMEQANVILELPQRMPQILVADARNQLGAAVGETLRGATALLGGASELHIEVAEEGLRVQLRLDAAIAEPTALHVKSLLAPLGGAIEVHPGETALWLPRA